MKLSKELLLLLIAGFLLAIIFVGVFLLFRQPSEKEATVIPTPTLAVFDKDPITYDTQASQKAWGLVKKKPQLSAEDALAKKKLIDENPGTKDVIHQTNDAIIKYTPPFDMFHVLITTTDIEKAKNETVSWFKSYGLSQEAICTLPIIFDVDVFTAQSLKDKNINFSPLPPGCE